MQVQSINNNNNQSFGAYFNKRNAIHLKRLFPSEFNESSRCKLLSKLDWFTNTVPNHELEIIQYENTPGVKIAYTSLYSPGRRGIHGTNKQYAVSDVILLKGKYTIFNKETGNSANIFADDIFQFFDGIVQNYGILFSKTKDSLTYNLKPLFAEVMTQLTTKQ